MAYCLYTDLVKRLGTDKVLQLTDDDKSGAIDTDITSDAISEADALIDAKLNTRYPDTVPFSTTPAIIKRVSVLYACYYLHTRRFAATEAIKDLKAEADKILEDILNGSLSIPEIDTSSRYWMNSTSYNAGTEWNPEFRRMHQDDDGNDIEDDSTVDTW